MRISRIFCSMVLSLSLFFLVGCGDTGESLGKEAKALGEKVQKEVEAEKDVEKKKKIVDGYKPQSDAMEARYNKLSAEEKAKCDKIVGAPLSTKKS